MADDEFYEDDEMVDEDYPEEGAEFDEQGLPPEEEDHDGESSLGAALSQQMRSAPWYMGSVGVHVVIFLILLALPTPPRQKEKKRTIIRTAIVEEEEPEFEELIEPDIVENETPVDTEVDMDTPMEPEVNVEVTDIDVDIDMEMDEPQEDAPIDDAAEMGDIGEEDIGAPPVLGLSGSRSRGGGKFGFRASGSGKKRALRRGGGDKRTENAVDWALQWLAIHQEPDGSWDPKKYEGSSWQTGITCLGLLAFLGGGNSSRFGKYRNNVKMATDWLMRQQKPNGAIGSHRYECGIALMALAEAYGMSGDRRVQTAAEKIGEYCAQTQFRCGGWDYSPAPKRTDLSVTGWYVMGLKSARVADIKIPSRVYERATEYFHYCTADNGTAMYAMQITEDTKPKELKEGGSATMGAASLTCMQFLGRPRDDPKVTACAERQLKSLPHVEKRDSVHYYLLYYQALGLFQMGTRSVYWRRFNPLMKEKLLAIQEKNGTFEEKKGSWDPMLDHHGKHWSRVGSTAIACLTLQVYYRYMDVHGH